MRSACSLALLVPALAVAALLAATTSCSSSRTPVTDEPSPKPSATEAPPPEDPFGKTPATRNDFAAPVFTEGAPASAPQVFAQPDATTNADGGAAAGPCLFEPELGSLFPSNWLRPRFRFTTQSAENLFEIKLVIPKQTSPLVVYTTKSGYTLEKAAWDIITATGTGTVKVTVRSATIDASGKLLAGPFKGSEGEVEIAPPQVRASGSVLYWTTSGGTVLKGFRVGDETVQSVITPAQAGTACIACHTSTPDGLYAAFTASANAGDGSPGTASLRSIDGTATEPPFLTAQAKALLNRQPQHAPSFSAGHWKQGDRIALTMFPVNGKTEIIWTDLETTSEAQGVGWNVLARGGDNGHASGAAFSHDGTKVVYASTAGTGAGLIANEGRLLVVPFANRQGGATTPLGGASEPGFNQFYPTFSADDQLVAFNRVPSPPASSYNNPNAEVFVVEAAGGTPVRLAANDPPACLTSKKSPGITNSWPKWSPEVQTVGAKSYAFLVFSSTRNPTSNGPQLYVAPIVVEGGTIKTYAALYLWNQPENENNHTPAWDVFQLPGPK